MMGRNRPIVTYVSPYKVRPYWIKGDHAGSDASPGVWTRCSLRPVTSIDQICEPCPPRKVRENISTRPLGAQVGPSSSQPVEIIRAPLPSGRMTPTRKVPPD